MLAIRQTVNVGSGSKRAVKTCPRRRQLSPKAAMTAPFPRSRRLPPEQGEAGRPCRAGGRSACVLGHDPCTAFGSPAGLQWAWRRGSACLRGTSFAVRLAAPEPGSFPTRPSPYPRRHGHGHTTPDPQPVTRWATCAPTACGRWTAGNQCKNSSFARHYDQIRFRFRTARTRRRREAPKRSLVYRVGKSSHRKAIAAVKWAPKPSRTKITGNAVSNWETLKPPMICNHASNGLSICNEKLMLRLRRQSTEVSPHSMVIF
jgi:hypothetical protein